MLGKKKVRKERASKLPIEFYVRIMRQVENKTKKRSYQ